MEEPLATAAVDVTTNLEDKAVATHEAKCVPAPGVREDVGY